MVNQPPLIPLTFCDVPTQRFYIASLIALIQSYKAFQFFDCIWFGSSSEERNLWLYWSCIDALLIGLLIPSLRIPRLRFGVLQRLLILSLMLGANWLLAGKWHFGLSFLTSLLPLPRLIKSWFDHRTNIMGTQVRLEDILNPASHIIGEHTIRILPYSTAKLNPSTRCFCLPSGAGSAFVSIPIVFNNSIPYLVQYSVFNFTTGEKSLYNLTRAQLRPISKKNKSQKNLDDWLENEEGDWPRSTSNQAQSSQQPRSGSPATSHGELELGRTQHLYNIEIPHIGVIRLERVLDDDNVDVRIARTEALIVECPRASFASRDPITDKKSLSWLSSTSAKEAHKCVGQTEDFGLLVQGVAPLSLTYQQIINGQRKLVNLDGITPSEFVTPLMSMDASTLSEKLMVSHRSEYTWAESQSIEIPLNVSLSTPGQHIYQLDSLKDACGHSFDFRSSRESRPSKKSAQSVSVDKKSVQVHSKSQISFVGCGNTEDEPLRLLKGKSVSLTIAIQAARDASDPPWTVGVSYTPPMTAITTEPVKGTSWKKEYIWRDSENVILATEAGTYEITSLEGRYCQGDILVPSACLVVEQPMPTIDLKFTSITDQCSGEIGLQANCLLTGKPPFALHYLISQVGRPPRREVKIIQNSRDEILIQPDSPGQFEYSFIRLDDQFYKNVDIVGKSIQQTVHPLAQARFARGGRDKNIWSCSGETVEAEIELKGAPPYSVAYQIQGEAPQVVAGISSPRATLDIEIPKTYAKEGGSFILSLISITDGNGCLRKLSVPDLNIEVHRTMPTLKFYGTDVGRKIVAREGDLVSLPMRLTGNGPWTIEYTHNDSDQIMQQVVYGSNDELLVDKDGKYTLKAVRDSHCPGAVSNPTFEVEWLPKPSVMVSPQNSGDLVGGAWIKPAVCELKDDSIELALEGTPPFSISYYVLRKPYAKGKKVTKESRTIQVLKSTGLLPLYTAEPGQYTYSIIGLSDSIYSTSSPTGLINAQRSGEIQIQQDVLASPQGIIKTLPKTTYCVDETLSESQHGKGVKIELTGKAPFEVEVEVKNQVTQIVESFNLHLESASTILSVPYTFRSAAPHFVTLKSLIDANGCTTAGLPNLASSSSAIIEVAEIASIKPVLNKPYFCVGESLDFLLKGSPPWLIKYEFNGRKSSATIISKDEPKFSRLATEPGVFKILGIAHKEDLCIAKVGLEKVIRPIPAAKISSGKKYVEYLREGDQSELVITFQGTPPFSFTYTRSSADSRSGSKQVLETHSVTDIQDYTYSIFTSEEGTWSVTYVQDAFCSFPPVTSEMPPR